MVRRLKTDPTFAKKWDGTPRFPPRVLEPIEVPYTDEEREIHAALREYTKLRTKRATDNAERFATEFVLKTLKKRLFSSPAAFLTTLERHEESLRSAKKKAVSKPKMSVLQREFDRMEEEYADDYEYDEATADALDSATRLFTELDEQEAALLKKMKKWADRARAQRDSKANQLIQWLNETIKPSGKWSNERVIIFTEYRATQNWLQEVLATEGFSGGDRLLTMYGGMDSEQREAVKAAFQTIPRNQSRPHPAGDRCCLGRSRLPELLLAADPLRDSLESKSHGAAEWSRGPSRTEGRQGSGLSLRRRRLQANVPAQQFSGHASDMDADLEFLMRVALKIETIREDLGKVGPVIAEQVEEAMLGRRSALQTDDAERDAQPIRKMLRFERDLHKQVQALMEQYRETRRELRLSPENIQKVVTVALQLAGQPALIPTKTEDGKPCFQLPPLRGSWAACAEGLEHPHTKEIRPITFNESVSKGRDDVVLVHLNHRLPQMCLAAAACRSMGRERPVEAPAGDRPSGSQRHHRHASDDRPCPARRDRWR